MIKAKDSQILILMDDLSWRWDLCKEALISVGHKFVRMPSSISIKHSWERFCDAPYIIVHWGTEQRGGGAILEQIKHTDQSFDIGDRVIVLIDNPTHEDIVYFAELGVLKTVPMAQFGKGKDLTLRHLEKHLSPLSGSKEDHVWRKLIQIFDNLPHQPEEEMLAKLETKLAEFQQKTSEQRSARYLNLKGLVHKHRTEWEEAEKYFKNAIEKNPKYYRAQNNLVDVLRKTNRPEEAMTLLRALHEQNRLNIKRMADMGQIFVDLNDDEKAEHYFLASLARDARCDAALNGMADIRFRQDRLEEAKEYLSKTESASYAASRFNKLGVAMVKKKQFEQALEHYKKAQYVLPQQEKDSMLMFNIGLCYSRWGRLNLAREYLSLALIKDPSYEKAQRLLSQINEKVRAHSQRAR